MLLPNDELHIHLLQPNRVDDVDTSSLDEEEQQRAASFKFPKDRELYVTAHVFLRQVLSHYAEIEPSMWQFSKNDYGKPYIANSGYQWLNFNLSHTQGLIAFALSKNRSVGIDVEYYRPLADLGSLCQFALSPREAQEVLAYPPDLQEQRFFSYWTLKEAYIKARGLGLSLPLQTFSFVPSAYQTWQLCYESNSPEDKDSWQFSSLRVGHCQLAYCIQSTETPLTSVRIQNCKYQAGLDVLLR